MGISADEKKALKLQKKEEDKRLKAEKKAKKEQEKAEKKAAKEAKKAAKKAASGPASATSSLASNPEPSPAAASDAPASPAANPPSEDKPDPEPPVAAAAAAAAPPEEPTPEVKPGEPEPTPEPEPEPEPAAEPEKPAEPTPEPPAPVVAEKPAPPEPEAPPAAAAEPTPEPAPAATPELAAEAAAAPAVAEAPPPPKPAAPVEAESPPPPKPVIPATAPRRNSARRSIHGAPSVFQSKADKYEPTGAAEDIIAPEMVEDDCDERVGQMTSMDSSSNAQYLATAIEKLRERMRELYDDGSNRGYSKAYQALGMVGRGQPCSASQREANKLKNRYGNISAYDHSRVVLPVVNDDPDTDYVNANWVNGYNKPQHYVASQGPVPNSFISFWRLVWFMKAETVVMVTHEVEKGRMKCHRYWPDPTSSPPVTQQQYGDILVRHVSSVPHKHFVVRTFVVERNGETRSLRQFAYTSWPDHGVPLTTAEMLGFRNAINHAVTNTTVPILIHCSAGVGRTGTYIAIDRLVRQALDRGGELDVDKVIHEMRMARNYMVQTEVQYMFIYRAVLDCLSELLADESKKAEATAANDDSLRALQEAANAAAAAKEEEQRKEQEMIEKAKLEVLAGADYSAQNAAAVIKQSIKQRMESLRNAQDQWIEKYKKSLEEWSTRNQFEAEQYDLSSSLTPMQSRLEALRQKGIVG